MAIWADDEIRLLVQGITGHQGIFHTKAMIEFGTRIVAGVTPGKKGQEVHNVPVYDTVEDAMTQEPNASILAFGDAIRHSVGEWCAAFSGSIVSKPSGGSAGSFGCPASGGSARPAWRSASTASSTSTANCPACAG